jgi:NhaA family Na+:H+ antiporter
VRALDKACEFVETPLQRLEPALHPWMAFFIMPIFALANAGVKIGANVGEVLLEPVALGILAGLVAGKQIGITLFSWVSVRLRLASLPTGVGWKHIYGAGWLAGIGFTMSIFIATLAFESEDLQVAKTAILAASLIAGVGGSLYLSRLRNPDPEASE